MPCPSATFTVWALAWLHGTSAPDDVLDALHAWAALHEVVAADPATASELQIPCAAEPPASLVDLLGAVRRIGARGGRVLLPVPGDVRGLPAEGPLGPSALDAAELAVLTGTDLGEPELAIVPTMGADSVLRWTVFVTAALPPAPEPGLPDAEHGLRGSVRQAATALVDLDVARHRPGVRDEIARTLERRVRPPWPEGTPPRALRVLQQADEVEAIVVAANTDEPGGALSASAASARSAALRPLSTAIREARRSAVAEAVRALTQHAGRH